MDKGPLQKLYEKNGTSRDNATAFCDACGKPFDDEGRYGTAFATQVAGDHYRKLGDYQPWMVCSAWMTDDELRGAAKKDVIAYLARERDKGGIDDIRKAMHTLQIFLELWDKRQGK